MKNLAIFRPGPIFWPGSGFLASFAIFANFAKFIFCRSKSRFRDRRSAISEVSVKVKSSLFSELFDLYKGEIVPPSAWATKIALGRPRAAKSAFS